MFTEKLANLFLESEKGALLANLSASGGPIVVEGVSAPAKAYIVASLAEVYPKIIVAVANDDTARAFHDDLSTFLPNSSYYFPPSDVWSASPDPEANSLRVTALDALVKSDATAVLVGPIQALLQRTAGFRGSLKLKVGEQVQLQDLEATLTDFGYERTIMVEMPGQFAVRGGIVDIYASNTEQPVRMELFGDEIETIRFFDPETQRSVYRLDAVEILPARESAHSQTDPTALHLLPPNSLLVIDEPNTVHGHYAEFLLDFRRRLTQEPQELSPVPPPTTYIEWDDAVSAVKSARRIYLHAIPRSIPWETSVHSIDAVCTAVKRYFGQMSELASDMRSFLADGEWVVLFTDRQRRVLDLLAEHQIQAEPGEFSSPSVVQVVRGRLSEGFAVPQLKLRVLTDVEMFGERRTVKPRRTFKLGTPILAASDLKEGDYVVHINHGIGIYRGLVRLAEGGTERDFLRIDYAGGDKIYVPTDQLDRVQKYIGSGEHPPEIHRLGSGAWGKTTARVRAKVREMAKELLQLYAARAASQGYAYGPDTIWQQEMEDAFPYTETPDQARAIEEVKRDLESPVPMDRLICGDVGYGKTEVAVRAAFKVAVEGKQVAVLVPTTVLAEQHLETFQERMKGFPIRIEMLSRFKTPAERRRILEGLKDGSVDIVIGTHMLLSKNVQFHDLGLLVIDEEHRFGVAHKERLKQLKTNVDVITLTATPIPRTLHMALSGIRDMSLINDPPEGRMAIKTYLSEYSDTLVRNAILKELDRGGQVFVVYNRVEKIDLVASRIQRLVPQAKVGVGHGQMPERQLEQIMWEFYHRKFNVLVCSTIIESGLDIPNANTIIIFDADRLGLAQLYQLRGRVGRSNRQAYCYLLYRKNKILSESAQKRLQTIREFTELGSGFQIAMKDLEIRGAGNLLGPEQSGFLEAVGFELYCQMIADAVRELKGEKEEVVELPPVDVHVDAYIPADYIPSEGLRIAFYKRLASVRTSEDLQRIQEELEDRFGDPPPPVWNIIQLIHMRLLAHACGIAGVSADSRRAVFRLSQRLTRPDINILSLRHKHWYPQIDRVEVEISGKSDILQAVNQNLRILAGYLKPGVDKQVPLPKRRRARKTALTAK